MYSYQLLYLSVYVPSLLTINRSGFDFVSGLYMYVILACPIRSRNATYTIPYAPRLVRILRVVRVLHLISELRAIVSSIAGSLGGILKGAIFVVLFIQGGDVMCKSFGRVASTLAQILHDIVRVG